MPETRLDKCFVKLSDCAFSWSFNTPKLENETPKLAL